MAPHEAESTAIRLLTAAVAAAVATVITAALHPFLAQNIFLVYGLAILGVALWGGLVPGLAATLVSTAGLAFAVLDPHRSLVVDATGDRVRLVVLVFFGVLISALAEMLRSARRRAAERERSLRESEASYRSLFTQTAEALCLIDGDGIFVEANPEACRMFGLTRDQLVGLTPAVLTPEERADPGETARQVAAALAGEHQRFSWWGRRASGEIFPLEVALAPTRYFGEEVVIAALRDLTEQRRLEEQLRQAQKMEAVGRLASGVAHDFNNILTTIRGRADLLAERISPHDPLREDMDELRRAAELAGTVTRQLLTFGRRRPAAPAPASVSLRAVVGGIEGMLRRTLGERITLVTVLSPDHDRVRADAGQLEQVVMNLVLNARDAMPDGGTITLASGPAGASAVRLSVRDTGIGMDDATVERVFEPFFTTKAPGQGTGLGLSTVYGIVRQHDGSISIRSAPRRGTTVDVVLPSASPRPTGDTAPAAPSGAALPERAREAASSARGAGAGIGGGGAVLLIEDEAPVRSLVRKVLVRHGYEVVEARNGKAAREAWRRDPGRFRLVLADIGLPDVDGRMLADELAAERAGVPVLLTSGYGGELDDDGARGFLPKPFTPAQLLSAVRGALVSPAA